MYLAIIILPLLGSIVSGFYGRKVGVSGAQMLTTLSVIITTIFAISVFFEVAFNNITVGVSIFRWIDLELADILWQFNFDFLTVSMLIPVLIISSLVHVYSIGYMSHDPHNQRFFSYLSLFTFMMVILVTSNNFLLMFVGWEGVGICSYLLVNFWFTRIAANQSSISALLTNRVGDCFLTIGMFIILLTFGNLDYTTVFSLAPFISENSVTIIGICLLLGAMAKSSQIGLHVWLPLAMEGPTPVSALIHAATMVTAGVYLLMRASPLIEYSGTVLLTCLWIGSITTVFSSVIGLFQQDIKKVIAYSTMSQLGMMVIAIGLSSYNVALFHLVNHAFYKGLLFLGAGAVIHAVMDNQDFRKYGALILFLPLSYTVMLIASLSLVAFPFMTGFYSKDFILESCFAQFNYSSIAVYFTALIGAMFTTLYSVKVLYLTFIANPSSPAISYNKTHESDIFMSIPLVILALFSVYFGFITKDIFIGLGSHAFTDNSLFIHPVHEISLSSEFAVDHFYKLLPFVLTVTTLILSIIVLEFIPKMILIMKYTRIGYNIFAYLNLKFLVESIYNRFVTYFILRAGGQTTKILDKGSVEKVGPYGLETFLIFLSRNLNTLNTGVVTTYALYILMGFIFYISLPYILKDSAMLFLIMFCGLLLLISTSNIKMIDVINVDSDSDKMNNTVKSTMDHDMVITILKVTGYSIIAACFFATVRKKYNESLEGNINNNKYTETNSKYTETDSNTVFSHQLNDSTDTTIEKYSKLFLDHYQSLGKWIRDKYNIDITDESFTKLIFDNNYSPSKWLCDMGDVLYSYPKVTALLLPSIGITTVLVVLLKKFEWERQNLWRFQELGVLNEPIDHRLLDEDGRLINAHAQMIERPIPELVANLEREMLQGPTHDRLQQEIIDRLYTTTVIDQSSHNIIEGYVFTNTFSQLKLVNHHTIPGHQLIYNSSTSMFFKNNSNFRDFANTSDGISTRPGYHELVVSENERIMRNASDLTDLTNHPWSEIITLLWPGDPSLLPLF